MDERHFDQLSRRLGASRSRRQALRAFAGALVAGVAGVSAVKATIAQECVKKNRACQSDGECCPGMVCEWGMCRSGCRIDGKFANPRTSPAGNICQVCDPAVSTTSGTPTREGRTCWSGNASAGMTTCQNGVCQAHDPISCPPLTACHLEGTVNPANGLCEYQAAPAGTLCGAAEMCHGGFYSPAAACDGNGHCIGGGTKTVNCAPYLCNGTACATSCANDNECVGDVRCCEGLCVNLGTVNDCAACGDACEAIDACTPATCDNGVCIAAGPACTPINDCHEAVCENGVCHQKMICTAVDECTPAACIEGACNERSACTEQETCGGGGVIGQCGCTPNNSVCRVSCNESDGCGGVCAGQTATSPAITVTFELTSERLFCRPTVHLTGFEGCTQHTIEYSRGQTIPSIEYFFSESSNKTDPTGSSDTELDADIKDFWMIAKVGDVSSATTRVNC